MKFASPAPAITFVARTVSTCLLIILVNRSTRSLPVLDLPTIGVIFLLEINIYVSPFPSCFKNRNTQLSLLMLPKSHMGGPNISYLVTG